MMERAKILLELIRKGLLPENRRHFLLIVILCLAGVVLAVGAAYPILSPFLYSMF
jgi:hypothetical protein